MNVTTKLRVDLQKRSLQPEIDAVQGDAYSRYLELSLYTRNVPWIIPKNTLVAVRYRKEDHTGGYYDTLPDGTSAWHFQENVVTVQLAPQMLTVPGCVYAQVELILENAVLATFGFTVRVEANAAAGALRSETYTNWLDWMKQQLSNCIASGAFTGPQGPAGPVAQIVRYTTEYQAGESGTNAPTGSWTTQIPTVHQGQYLWTRTTQTYSSGDTVETYTVTRFGIDGTGSVSSVAGISPGENGNVPLAAKNVGALPITGGTMSGPVFMNGQKLSGLTAPTEDDEAAPKGYADAVKSYATGLLVRNLLDNSNLRNPVNQRGVTSGTLADNEYFLDRWKAKAENTTYSVGSDGLTFHGTVAQFLPLEKSAKLKGSPLTVAVKIEGIVYCKTLTAATVTDDAWFTELYQEHITGNIQICSSGGMLIVMTIATSESTMEWAALYEGVYTAETLPPYVPKGYGDELAECQRYYQLRSTNDIAAVDLRPSMRLSAPTVTAVEYNYSYSADL